MNEQFKHTACPNFQLAKGVLSMLLKNYAVPVEVETWQGMDVRGRPDMRSHELLNVTMHVLLQRGPLQSFDPFSLDHWRQDCAPNLPWADEHFAERVGGTPVNPPPSWRIWPWASSADKFRRPQQGAAAVECEHGYDHCPKCNGDPPFDHSYPERFWPIHAGKTYGPGESPFPNKGIRFNYGDLLHVVQALAKNPHTRQAYLPIYFPEDNHPDAKRKPCTLGYHFIMRDKRLHLFYPMRSCDFVRHWADDCYLAVRLLLWVIESCRGHEKWMHLDPSVWETVEPGTLTMHMTSLHVFENDMRAL